MSYIIIRLYSFECDAPGCQATADVTPTIRGGIREARRLLREETDVRAFGTDRPWRVASRGEFCPRHSGSLLATPDPAASS